MLDHASIGVSNFERSQRFYDAALRSLGLVRTVDFGSGRASDYGAAPGPLGVEFTIIHEPEVRTPIAGAHLCFRAPDRAAVHAFHGATLATGGSDDGQPGTPTTTPRSFAIRMVTASSGVPHARSAGMVSAS